MRALALGGVVGPAAFVTAWAALGAGADRYDPTRDAISQLAALHAPTRAAMTGGLVVLGTGMALYGTALHAALPGGAWAFAVANGALTLGLAAVPLGASHDTVHGAVAGLSYVTLAAIPVLTAPELARRGRRKWAMTSVATGVVSGVCLLATLAGARTGLFQRLGLTTAQLWVVASALTLLSTPAPHQASGSNRPLR